MLKNYLKIAIRNMIKDKSYALLNIVGVATGLGFFIFLTLFADTQFNFDRGYKDADRIHAVIHVYPSGNRGERHSGRSPVPLIPVLVDEIPEIEDGTRFEGRRRTVLKYKDKHFYENRVWYVDQNFLSFFSLKMIDGDPQKALKEPDSIVLTEKMAKKYFDEDDPLGKVLTMDNKYKMRVTGVCKNVSADSGLTCDFLIPIIPKYWNSHWDWYCSSFVRLSKEANHKLLEEKFTGMINRYYKKSPEAPKSIYIFPIGDLYFYGHHIKDFWWVGELAAPIGTMVIGVLLLLVVCFNYVNLSTARYVSRVKEVGVRKVCGASRYQLMGQFLSESILICLIAFPLSLAFFEIFRPILLSCFKYFSFHFDMALWDKPFLLLKLLFLTLILGVAAGAYPAFILSRQNPVQVFKGHKKTGRDGGKVRKILVISQFVFSIGIVICSIVFAKQFKFIMSVDLGFNRDNVMVLPLEYNRVKSNINALKNNLIKNPDIKYVFTATGVPVAWYSQRQFIPEGFDQTSKWTMYSYGIGYDFLEALDMKIIKGNGFSRKRNETNHFVINKTAQQRLGWDDPVGKTLTVGKKKGIVIGVVKDYHFVETVFPVSPSILYLEEKDFNFLFVKFSGSTFLKVRAFVKKQWKKFLPDLPFEYRMLNDYFYSDNADMKGVGVLVSVVGIVTFLFSVLGLLGVVSFVTLRRTKEIGIRKVLGASVFNILKMLYKDFFQMILISILIASLLAYFLLKLLLLKMITYQTEIGILIFVLTGIFTLFITFITVASQTYRAATANPVEALRYE